MRGFLVDAFSPDAYGGTGQVADWLLAAEAAAVARILLAGGLTPDNVAQAIGQVRPYGVDVSSGVEARPGKKTTPRFERSCRPLDWRPGSAALTVALAPCRCRAMVEDVSSMLLYFRFHD